MLRTAPVWLEEQCPCALYPTRVPCLVLQCKYVDKTRSRERTSVLLVRKYRNKIHIFQENKTIVVKTFSRMVP